MSVLFIDGFDHYVSAEIPRKWDGYQSGLTTIDNTNPRRSGGLHLRLGASTLSGYVRKAFATVPDTIAVGFALKVASFPSAGQHRGFKLSSGGEATATVVVNQDGSVSVMRGDYNGTEIEASAAGVVPNAWIYFEFKIYVHDSAGTYEVRINGSNVVSGSSVDTKGATDSGVDQLALVGDDTGGDAKYIDDLYIDDADFLGDCRVDLLMPDGAGNYDQWTPDPSGTDNYANVDDDGDMDDDSTYNVTDVGNEIDSFTFDNLVALGVTIHAVALTLGTRKDDAGFRGVTTLTRISTNDYLGDEIGLWDDYGARQYIWENPPSDPSVAWTEAVINGAEFGYKLTT